MMNEWLKCPQLARLLPLYRSQTLRRERIIVEVERLTWTGKTEGYHGQRLLIRDIIPAYVAILRERGVRISRSTIYLWRARYREGGLPGLIDKRHLRVRKSPRRGRIERLSKAA